MPTSYIVEDHASFRDAMALLLEREGINVVGQAGTLVEARQLLTRDAHVAVVDLGLPDGSGIEFIKELRELNPESVVLVLSASIDPKVDASAIEIIEAAKAAVGKSDPPSPAKHHQEP